MDSDSPTELLQFLVSENQLREIYQSITAAAGSYTDRTLLLLSKPEKTNWKKKNVYDDYYILTLRRYDRDAFAHVISDWNRDKSKYASLIMSSLQQGLTPRPQV